MAECSVEPFSLHRFRDVIDLCRTFAAEADASVRHGDLTALLYLQGYSDIEFSV